MSIDILAVSLLLFLKLFYWLLKFRTPNFKITWSRDVYIRTLLFFALNKPDEPNPLLDIRVRQAIRYAIDYNSIAKHVFHNSVTPTWNLVAPYHTLLERPKTSVYSPREHL